MRLLLRSGTKTWLWRELSRNASTSVPTFLSTHWLASNTEDPDVQIVHASWSGQCEDWATVRIPSARCFDGTKCRDVSSPYKNMLPSPQLFEEVAQDMGISENSHVVVYDISTRLPSMDLAPRVWWLFRVFGHERVSLLEGGLAKWLREQRPVREGAPKTPLRVGDFQAKLQPNLIRHFSQVAEAIERGSAPIVDARPSAVFTGEVDDPFGLDGHAKGAINVPLASLIDPQTGMLRSKEELEKKFGQLRREKEAIFHCNTGLHACGVLAAAHSIGIKQASLYDGSWQEFAVEAKGRENTLLQD